MNDTSSKTPAVETPGDARLAATIERTLPAIDPVGPNATDQGTDPAPAPASPATTHKRNGRPPGRKDSVPRKTSKRTGAFVFAPPDEAENLFSAPDLASVQPEPMAEPRDPQDFIDYGIALAGIHAGYYEAKAEPVLADAAKKLPAHTVETLRSRLVVSDRTRGNLEKGYAMAAEKLNAPRGGADVLGWLHAARSLHVQQMAALSEIREYLRTFPDMKAEPSA